jgi:hypothetical protein
MEEEKVFTVHIGETDILEWTQGIGKAVLMPILLKVCEEVIYDNLEEKVAAKVQFSLKGKPKIYDFVVKFDGMEDTLEKIMGWALDKEEYEMCQSVKYLQEYVKDLRGTLNDKQKTRVDWQ